MRQIILAILLLLTACDNSEESWDTAIYTHKCDSKQMKKVEREAKWCSDNSSYLSTYCYNTAIIRNCEKEKVKEKK